MKVGSSDLEGGATLLLLHKGRCVDDVREIYIKRTCAAESMAPFIDSWALRIEQVAQPMSVAPRDEASGLVIVTRLM